MEIAIALFIGFWIGVLFGICIMSLFSVSSDKK